MLTMMSVAFVVFGMFSKIPFMSAFLIVFGAVILCGTVLAIMNSRKLARAALSEPN